MFNIDFKTQFPWNLDLFNRWELGIFCLFHLLHYRAYAPVFSNAILGQLRKTIEMQIIRDAIPIGNMANRRIKYICNLCWISMVSPPRVYGQNKKLAAKTHIIINVSLFLLIPRLLIMHYNDGKKFGQFFHATVYQIIAKCWLIRFAYNLAKRKTRNSFPLQFRFRTIKPFFPFLFAFCSIRLAILGF